MQPQSKGTVHHYPAHCNGNRSSNSDYHCIVGMADQDKSRTTNDVTRVNYQCAVAESGVTRNETGVVQVKREVMDDQTQPSGN